MGEKIKKVKLTEKHLKFFHECCKFYQKELGLLDWAIYIQWFNSTDGTLAECKWDLESRVAVIYLAREWGTGDPINELNLDATALHEILHIRLADLDNLITDQVFDSIKVKETEKVIRSLEQFIISIFYEK